MTRFFILLILVTAAGGTFYAVSVLMGDSDGARQTNREERAEGHDDRRRDDYVAPERKKSTTARNKNRLSGFVFDTSRTPVRGALVRLPGGVKIVTAGDGHYSLDTEQTNVTVNVRARGYLPLVQRDTLIGADTKADFILERAAVLTGHVTDSGGRPVKGATVYRVSAEHQIAEDPVTARTNAEGEYLFPGLEQGVADLGVRVVGFLPALVRDVGIEGLGEHRQDFVLQSGRTVRFVVEGLDPNSCATVIAADSKLRSALLPPGGVRLLEDALLGREFLDRPVVTAVGLAIGASTLTGLPHGPVDFSLRRNKHWITELGSGRLLDNVDSEITLTAIPARLVAPVVRDAVTREVIFPKVTRISDGETFDIDVFIEGKLFLVPQDTRRHSLRFELAGYVAKTVEVPKGDDPDEDEMEVELQPAADSETGKLRLVFDPQLKGRLGVIGRREGSARQFTAAPGPKGHWIVEKIPVGSWGFTFLGTGMVPVKVPDVRIVAGTTQELTVVAHAGGGIELRIEDESGNLLDKVSLELRAPDETRGDIHFLTMVSGQRGFTSINDIPSAATARADSGLAPGSYTLWAGREGYEASSSDFSIAGTEVEKVTVTLKKK